jgi:hypothetical protein
MHIIHTFHTLSQTVYRTYERDLYPVGKGEDAEAQVDEDAAFAHEGQRPHRLLHRDLGTKQAYQIKSKGKANRRKPRYSSNWKIFKST